jgi:hypothetical protein
MQLKERCVEALCGRCELLGVYQEPSIITVAMSFRNDEPWNDNFEIVCVSGTLPLEHDGIDIHHSELRLPSLAQPQG